MGRGPSLTALLVLLVVAGWQNRDKFSEMLEDVRQSNLTSGAAATPQSTTGFFALLADNSRSFTGASAGCTLSNGLFELGLFELVKNFTSAGKRSQAESWVAQGKNKGVTQSDIEDVLDPQTLEQLSRRTGLSRQDLVERLSTTIRNAVDRFTAQGRIPSEDESFRAI